MLPMGSVTICGGLTTQLVIIISCSSINLFITILEEELVSPSELDPLNLHSSPISTRHVPAAAQKLQFRPHHRDVMIQIALISSTSRYVHVWHVVYQHK